MSDQVDRLLGPPLKEHLELITKLLRYYFENRRRRRSLQFFVCSYLCVHVESWSGPPMRWTDMTELDPDGVYDMEIFFDRLIAIVLDVPNPDQSRMKKDHVTITTGVMIANGKVLTSYNAFRNLTNSKFFRGKITLALMYGRTLQYWKTVTYDYHVFYLECARQVIPISDSEMPSELWHEPGLHSPLHDIMVIRTGWFTFIDPNPALYSFDNYNKHGSTWLKAGYIKTYLARVGEEPDRYLMFASIGHVDEEHVWSNQKLRSGKFDPEDNVIADCDEWVPRDWGHFICLRNVKNYVGIASGAMLFADNKLFGIGSFALFKGKQSILVFTDVRPYYDLITSACSDSDQI